MTSCSNPPFISTISLLSFSNLTLITKHGNWVLFYMFPRTKKDLLNMDDDNGCTQSKNLSH
ncbi:hypothetical protein BpHYR1_004490 [Brachionus plicatilis]|uniref:Uncharacterized protein n=1 Tax=Brachionus plicatilis TaxID=10195 RepID=A0A3M7SA99_BRAPC|nr:hypothetical protein BpHYR1_004490 [Brachionus plicatilis]